MRYLVDEGLKCAQSQIQLEGRLGDDDLIPVDHKSEHLDESRSLNIPAENTANIDAERDLRADPPSDRIFFGLYPLETYCATLVVIDTQRELHPLDSYSRTLRHRQQHVYDVLGRSAVEDVITSVQKVEANITQRCRSV